MVHSVLILVENTKNNFQMRTNGVLDLPISCRSRNIRVFHLRNATVPANGTWMDRTQVNGVPRQREEKFLEAVGKEHCYDELEIDA